MRGLENADNIELSGRDGETIGRFLIELRRSPAGPKGEEDDLQTHEKHGTTVGHVVLACKGALCNCSSGLTVILDV